MQRYVLRAAAGRHAHLLVAVLWASVASAGSGQSEPKRTTTNDVQAVGPTAAAVVKVSWPDIAGLVDQHPLLAAGGFRIDVARGAADAAGAFPNPSLEATIAEGSARDGDQARTEWGLSLSLPLGWIAQRKSRLEVAEAEIDAAVAERKALRRDVLIQLRTLFWNLAYDQERVSALEALERQTAELVRTVRLRVEKGEARPVEGPRVEVELEKVTSELETARASLASRQAQLALWLGTPEGKTVVAGANLSTLPTPVDLETALSRTRTQHPALTAARARARALAAQLDREEMGRAPSFSLTGFADDELDRTAYGAGIAVELPLWNWNSGRIAEAAARLAAGRKEMEAIGLEIESSAIDVQAACAASVQAATRLKENVLPRSEAATLIIEKTYRLGDAGLLDVIDARRTLLEARRSYLSALVRAQIDCSRLRAFIGEDLS